MRSRLQIALIALMAFAMAFSAFPAYAQGDDGIYRLQIEDLLLVQIFNETQVNAQVPVGQDGNIAAPFVGSVKAAGRTVDELAAELTQLYIQRLRLRDPKVSVTIIRFRELKASVVGAVRQAGSFVIRRGDTVVSLIGRAFGIDSERADPYRATLRRSKSQEQIPIDLFALLYRGDTSQNYEIQDGDELLVPHETKNKVSLLGAIQRPNQYPYRDGMKLSDLIAMGGGEIPRTTMFSKTLVFRPIAGQADQYRVIKSDMVRFFTKGDYSQDILLQPGDLVVINKTKTPSLSDISQTVNSIWIFNLLSKQGLFGFSPF